MENDSQALALGDGPFVESKVSVRRRWVVESHCTRRQGIWGDTLGFKARPQPRDGTVVEILVLIAPVDADDVCRHGVAILP